MRRTQNLTSLVVLPIGTTFQATTGPTWALLLRAVLVAEVREQEEDGMANPRSVVVLRAHLLTSTRKTSQVSRW